MGLFGRKSSAAGRPPAKAADAKAAQVRHPVKAATLLYSAPSVILRGPIYMMFVALFAMLTYSVFATKDVLVLAPAKLQRQVVTVQAVSGGAVERVNVKENDAVSAGTPLAVVQEKIRVASTPEQEGLARERAGAVERRSQVTRDFEFRRRQVESERGDLERRLLTGQSALKNRIGQIENQLATLQQQRRNTETDLSTQRANAARLEPLCAARDLPITQCETARQQVLAVRRALAAIEADIRNADLSLRTARDELEQQLDQRTLDRLNADLAKLAEDHAKELERIDATIADLDRRRDLAATLVPGVRPGQQPEDRDKVYYTSVVDGVVTQVYVQPGQLIAPGEPVVTIVRTTAPLEARILVQNKDIGHLRIGQPVQLKYFAYPFQEYGMQSGSIAEIGTRPSIVPSEDSLYVVRVALARETTRSRSGVEKTLEIGLQGLAEIKTGEKRFIELLFAPAAKFFKPLGDDNDPTSLLAN